MPTVYHWLSTVGIGTKFIKDQADVKVDQPLEIQKGEMGE